MEVEYMWVGSERCGVGVLGFIWAEAVVYDRG